MIRDLIVEFLECHGFSHVTGSASSALLYRAFRRGSTGLVLVDLENAAEDPRKILGGLREHRPEATVVAIGTPMQLAAHAADADGWIEVSDPVSRVSDLATSLAQPGNRLLKLRLPPKAERLSYAWRTLTARQRQVLALLGCGVDNRKLATALGISERAVKAHVSALLDKFKADSRTELALIACHAKLHSPIASFPFDG